MERAITEDIISDKRDVDEIIFTYQPFFSERFIYIYKDLEAKFFRQFNGWGKDARLRSTVTHRKEFYVGDGKTQGWNADWDSRFMDEDNTDAIRKSYSAFIIARGVSALRHRRILNIFPPLT
jgi:hypothetical protein